MQKNRKTRIPLYKHHLRRPLRLGKLSVNREIQKGSQPPKDRRPRAAVLSAAAGRRQRRRRRPEDAEAGPQRRRREPGLARDQAPAVPLSEGLGEEGGGDIASCCIENRLWVKTNGIDLGGSQRFSGKGHGSGGSVHAVIEPSCAVAPSKSLFGCHS